MKYTDGQLLDSFYRNFNTFGFLKVLRVNDLKLSSLGVYYYQTCKFVFLGENIKRTKNDSFKTPKTIIFSLYFFEANIFA